MCSPWNVAVFSREAPASQWGEEIQRDKEAAQECTETHDHIFKESFSNRYSVKIYGLLIWKIHSCYISNLPHDPSGLDQAQSRYICHPRWGEVRPWLPPILLPRILSANIGKSNYYFVSFPILSMTWNLPVCAFCADNKDKQIYKIKRPLRRPAILLTWFCKTNVVEIREHVFVVIDIWFKYIETFIIKRPFPLWNIRSASQ